MDVDGRSQASFGSWVVWAGEVCAFITRSWYSDPPVRGRQTGATDSQRRGKGAQDPRWEYVSIFGVLFLTVFHIFLSSTFFSLALFLLSLLSHKCSGGAFGYCRWISHDGLPFALRAAYSQTIHVPTHAYEWWRTCPQPPSLLDLLSYLQTLYSFPPSGNSFHVNTTSICRAALSLHTSIAGLLISVTFRENKWCLYPSCLSA